MLKRVQKILKHYLLLANIGTSCLQIGTADVIQQHINGDVKRNGWDSRRTLRMAAIGLVMAPALHGFYKILDTRKFRGTQNCVVLKKLAVDTTFIPFFSCTFITVGALYEGNTLFNAFEEYRRKMWHIWKVDFTLWPPAQLFNFYFLPPGLRVVYVNIMSLVYNCILSYIKHNEPQKIANQ